MAGNIKIIEPTENFQKVSRDIIFTVDYQTLGVYVIVLALGKKWKLNIQGLSTYLQIGTDKVRSIFSKLEEAGYLRRYRVQGEDGKFTGWDYEVSSVPFADMANLPTSVKYRHRQNTDVGEKPTSEKSEGIYIDSKDNIDSKENIQTTKSGRFTPPSVEEVRAYCEERKNGLDAETFVDFYTSKGWKVGGNPMKDWKAAVRTWEKRHANDATPAAPSAPRKSKADQAFDNMMELGKKLGYINIK